MSKTVPLETRTASFLELIGNGRIYRVPVAGRLRIERCGIVHRLVSGRSQRGSTAWAKISAVGVDSLWLFSSLVVGGVAMPLGVPIPRPVRFGSARPVLSRPDATPPRSTGQAGAWRSQE